MKDKIETDLIVQLHLDALALIDMRDRQDYFDENLFDAYVNKFNQVDISKLDRDQIHILSKVIVCNKIIIEDVGKIKGYRYPSSEQLVLKTTEIQSNIS